jgi:presenilin-like A22 family membrane protease
MLMFVVTQLIGLYVANHYISPDNILPLGLEPPQVDPVSFLPNLLIAFVIAILLIFLLMKLKVQLILKLWFFVVIVIALTIALMAVFSDIGIKYAQTVALVLAFGLGAVKIFKKNFFVHNITELLVYPGIAVIFIPLLNVWTVIALLILISIYDIWAVWHSGIMQKMAKYQIDKVGIFAGFFVPYASKKVRTQIKSWKKTLSKSQLKKKKVKINVAILGGGDVVFPIITAGVMLAAYGIYSALFVSLGATLGLAYLFFLSEKKKFYPAMPFITAGILAGMGLSYLIL